MNTYTLKSIPRQYQLDAIQAYNVHMPTILQ